MIEYWEQRYAKGGCSGAGSRGAEAHWKATLLQRVIDIHCVGSVLDLGCGDGYVAGKVFVKDYTGYDPSATALAACRQLMPERRFVDQPPNGRFDLVVSMDVIFHLVTEELYRAYLDLLFSERSNRVFVYGTNHNQQGHLHVLHRQWIPDVPEGWTVQTLPHKHGKGAWLITKA